MLLHGMLLGRRGDLALNGMEQLIGFGKLLFPLEKNFSAFPATAAGYYFIESAMQCQCFHRDVGFI